MAALPSRLEIRAMQLDDLPAVIAIERVAYAFPWSEGVFADCLRAGYQAWMLLDGGLAIGYAIIAFGVDEAHLLNICVAPAWQGRGHGQTLLRHVLNYTWRTGVMRVLLEVRRSNLVAQQLYARYGFVEIGRRPCYYPAVDGREEAIVMALEWDAARQALRRSP